MTKGQSPPEDVIGASVRLDSTPGIPCLPLWAPGVCHAVAAPRNGRHRTGPVPMRPRTTAASDAVTGASMPSPVAMTHTDGRMVDITSLASALTASATREAKREHGQRVQV